MKDERRVPGVYGFESSACAEFPTYIMFDITNKCNSKCTHCPHSTIIGDEKNKATYLSFKIYKKVIDECKGRKIQFIRITADGEPLLHPRLFDMIGYAVQHRVGPVGLTTNGALLTPAKTKKLIESNIFMVDVSLDAFKKETYNKIRYGLSYEKVMNNIKFLLEYKKQANSQLKVMVSFVKQKENINELQEFIDYWEPLVDRVLTREMISNVNLVEVSGEENKKVLERWPCPHWFRRIVINYDGVIKACPVDWENGTAYKHISETTIYDAWHSRFYNRNRQEHLNNNFSEDSICKNCNDWQGSPWNLGYEKVIKSL